MEVVLGSVKKVSPKLLVFLLLIFILMLSGFVTSESIDDLSEITLERISFDVRIIDFESPMELGEFFEFTYLVGGMSIIDDDVTINFWIERQGEVITSGSDNVYIGDFEEKIETTKIFLPKSVESGVYDFVLEVIYNDYEAKSHRTIEIEIKRGLAQITTPRGKVLNMYVISFLVGLAIFILSLIFYLERRRIKKQFCEGERWIKKYKLFILVLCLFIILGVLICYVDFFDGVLNEISKAISGLRVNIFPYFTPSSFYYILGIILISILSIILINIFKRKKLFLKFRRGFRERKVKQVKKDKVLKKEYKARVKESKIKFKKISKSQNRIAKKLILFIQKINLFKLIKKIKIKKIKVKRKKKVKKIKKPIKIKKVKKKKIKIKNILGKNHPLKYIKRFFKKINSNLKKLKIKFLKKQKKKEKSINVKRVHEKQKKLEISRKIKFKKFWVRVKRIINRLGITTRKLFKFFKKKSKSTAKVLPTKLKKLKKTQDRLLMKKYKERVKVNKIKFKSWLKVRKQKKKEKLIKAKQLREKKKKEKISHRLKRKKIDLKFKKIISKTGNFTHKTFKFFKKKSKSSQKFVVQQTKHISKEEKKIVREKRKELKQRYKNIFRLLKRIFGRKSRKKIIRDFEKAVAHTEKFSNESLITLKEFVYPKKKIKKRKLNLHKLEELAKNTENLVRELNINFGHLLSFKKNKKKLGNKFKYFFLKITPKKLFKKRRKLEENRKSIKEFFDKI